MLDQSLGSIPVLYRRRDVSPEDFSRYWRDVHGVFVAQFLGPCRYRMLHFEAYDPLLWRDDAVDRNLVDERQLGGVAEFIFSNETDRQMWLSTVGSFADADDAVLFRRSTSYSVSKKSFLAFKKNYQNPDVDEGSTRIFAMLKANIPGENFRTFISEIFGPALGASAAVLHSQFTLYDPYHAPVREFFGGEEVERFLRPDEQHQGTAEIIFKDESALQQFFELEFPHLQRGFADHVERVHAYRVKGAYTLLDEGEMTLAGWLGASRAELVRKVNAENIVANLRAVNAERRVKFAGASELRGMAS
jgi:hypothetical protein